jgi:predicted dinucleotide-binding enzyme
MRHATGDDPEAVQFSAGRVCDAGFDPVAVGTPKDASRFQRGGPKIATAHDAMVTVPDELARRLARFGSTLP